LWFALGISQKESQDLVGISQNKFLGYPKVSPKIFLGYPKTVFQDCLTDGLLGWKIGNWRALEPKYFRTTFTTFTRSFSFIGLSGENCGFATFTDVHHVHHVHPTSTHPLTVMGSKSGAFLEGNHKVSCNALLPQVQVPLQ
jgi:hypothetical protein